MGPVINFQVGHTQLNFLKKILQTYFKFVVDLVFLNQLIKRACKSSFKTILAMGNFEHFKEMYASFKLESEFLNKFLK